MWTRQDASIVRLAQVVNETALQIQKLVEQVAELSAVVRVESVQRAEVQRRVDVVEGGQRNSRDHSVQIGDQWRLSVSMASISAFFSLVVSLLVHVLWH